VNNDFQNYVKLKYTTKVDFMIAVMASQKKKLVNLYEAANRLRVPPGWLRDAALAGKIPCLRVGKRKLRFELYATKEAIAELAAKGVAKQCSP